MYSKNLAQRLSRYMGTNEKSPWGPKARELDFSALGTHSPVATSVIDFGEHSFPNATALAATTLSATCTATAAADNSIVCNAHDGYMLVTAGSAADTGYSIQFLTTDVAPEYGMQFAPASSISTFVRETYVYWGARIAISTNTTWDGSISFGLWGSDTTPISTTTGLPTVLSGIMFNFDITGALIINKSVSSTNAGTTLTPTATTLAHSSSNFRARDFHDYFFRAKWALVSGAANAVNAVEAFIDGNHVGTINGLSLPNITATTMYNSFAVFNGDAATVTLACTEIINGYSRWHVGTDR